MGYSVWQQVLLVTLRVGLGWHLFLQGYGKLISHDWSAKGYLAGATGPFAPWFKAMASSDWWLGAADRTAIWGLVILGGLLVVGLFSRLAAVAGAVLLSSFYLALPPVAAGIPVPTVEGTEWLVNKLLIEVLALLVVASFPTGHMAGLDSLRPPRARAPRSLGA